MLGVIICANFGVEKLRGLGNTRGQILEFPIEMAGHPYNRAGATAQPVIKQKEKIIGTDLSKPNVRCHYLILFILQQIKNQRAWLKQKDINFLATAS